MVKNLPGHLACATHRKSAEEEQERQRTRELHDRIRAQDLERLQRPESQCAPLSFSTQHDAPVTVRPLPNVDEQQMWEDLEQDQLDTSIADADRKGQFNPTEQQEVEFNKVLDRAEMNSDPTDWDSCEEFNIRCEVDETLTKVMEDLGQSQKFFVSECDRAYDPTRPWGLTR